VQLAIYGRRYFYFQRTVVCWRAISELFALGETQKPMPQHSAETDLRPFCVFGLVWRVEDAE
jgi:hypothetical protein